MLLTLVSIYTVRLKSHWSKNRQFLFESFSRRSILLEKLLKIDIQSAKDIRKDVLIFQVWRSALAPPTSSVFRVVLLHTEAIGQRLLDAVYICKLLCVNCKICSLDLANFPIFLDFKTTLAGCDRTYFFIYTTIIFSPI